MVAIIVADAAEEFKREWLERERRITGMEAMKGLGWVVSTGRRRMAVLVMGVFLASLPSRAQPAPGILAYRHPGR